MVLEDRFDFNSVVSCSINPNLRFANFCGYKMRKTKVGNIEITIYPEMQDRVMLLNDFHIAVISDYERPAGEPGRARKLYDRLKSLLITKPPTKEELEETEKQIIKDVNSYVSMQDRC